MDEQQLLEKRLRELARTAYDGSRFTFSDFLGMGEQDTYFRLERELSYASPRLFGGHSQCERQMLRFGDPDELGYEEDYPLCCLRAEPTAPKFADTLTHRDLLGALMNLGIKRAMLGDIFLTDNVAYLFCHEKIAPFLLENLKKAKHTELRLSLWEQELPPQTLHSEERTLTCASERVDLLISKCYDLSRKESQELIDGGKLFVNGRICTDTARSCREGDVISLRGYGRFRFLGILSHTRKGNLNLRIEEYR